VSLTKNLSDRFSQSLRTNCDTRMPKNAKIPLRPIALDPVRNLPLVSILISNYNYGPYVGEAIESALHQSYTNLEVIVCDDGSTDDSREVLARYRSLEPRIKTIYRTNGGQSSALNAAFRESAGEILCLLDADDVFLPDKVRSVVEAFRSTSSSGFAANRILLVDRTRKRLGEIPSLYEIPSGWQGAFVTASGPQVLLGLPPTSGLSLRRAVAEAFFPLPEGLRAYSDTLIQTIAPLVTPVVALQTPLSEYRIHGANLGGVSTFTERQLRNIVCYEHEIWQAWRRYLASHRAGLPPDFPLPSQKAPSPMEYALARLRSSPSAGDVYRAIPRVHFQGLPKPHQLYWRAAVILPTWLFRRSFDFVYGQTRLKLIARRIFQLCRNRFRGGKWASKCGVAPLEAARHFSSISSAGSREDCSEQASFLVMGVRVDAVQIPDVVARMRQWIYNGNACCSIAPTGMHGVVEAQRDAYFKTILNATDLVVPDGTPLVYIGRNRGHVLPRRVYGPDLLLEFCAATEAQGYRHFFYGGAPGTAERLAQSLQVRFPGLQIAGALSPPFRPLNTEEDAEIMATIARSTPDLLWVGLGTPKQERWMHEHKGRLSVPVMVGVGAAFDILSGARQQAPRWMREHGLEWLFRLRQEPRRLWRRYLIGGVQFALYLAAGYLPCKMSAQRRSQAFVPTRGAFPGEPEPNSKKPA
jgi:N-acetylglucosaminyldiphosphoundecaprenol N-acetyl-beta-D-mannosaminyltransferase